VRGEYRFAGALLGEDPPQATLPITQSGLSIADADALNAFDIIALEADRCRFGDVTVMRTAQDLLQQGRSIAETVQIMRNVRTRAPKGRHKVVLTAHGAPALQWEDGLTDLDGQTLLPLADEGHASVDDLFDAAAIAEAEGERETALRLYDLCARADRTDPIAVYNIGNIRLSEGDHRAAILAYRRALARDPRFSEARYNLAQALEGAGDMRAAQTELERLVVSEPKQADAIFNLAQINMKIERFREAKTLFQRFLLLEPSADWRAKARKAIQYCLSRSPS
jgi:tetratricopeptide (TPR) repeat protein